MVGLISLLSLIANWQGAKNGLLFSQPNADIYNIDVTEQHPKTIDTALKHCETYGRYAAKSVCAVHTSAAFREACQFVDRFYQLRENGENGRKFVILDSGCGKGMSTVCLASLYPDIPVIGIDRSITRLSSNKKIEIRTNRSPLDSCKIKPFVQGSPGNASLIADALIDSRELLGNGDVGSHESKSKSKQNQVGSTEDSVMITCESNNNLVSCQKTSDKTVFDGNTTASSKLIESGIINDDKRKGGNIGESCYKTDDDNVDDDDDDYDNDNDNENENGKEDRASERNEENNSIQLRDNALLLRAELSDFFTLVAYQSDWVVHSHYLLYPNPYPKSKHLKRRWHGHPIFPVLLALGGTFTVRSNWRTYCEEIQTSVRVITESHVLPGLETSSQFRTIGNGKEQDGENNPSQNVPEKNVPEKVTTHFEKKYIKIGLEVFEFSSDLGFRNKEERCFMLNNIKKLS